MLTPKIFKGIFNTCFTAFNILRRIESVPTLKIKERKTTFTNQNQRHTRPQTHTLKITSLKLFTNPFLSRCIPGHHHPARHEVPLLLLTRIPRSPNHHQTILNWCKTWKSSSSLSCTKTMHIIIASSPAASCSVQWRKGRLVGKRKAEADAVCGKTGRNNDEKFMEKVLQAKSVECCSWINSLDFCKRGEKTLRFSESQWNEIICDF